VERPVTGTLTAARRAVYDDEHEALRESFARFLADAAAPFADEWRAAGAVPPAFFGAAAEHGFVGMAVAEEHGGAGVDDPRFGAVLVEEAMRLGLTGVALMLGQHNDVCVPVVARHATGDPALLAGLATGSVRCALVGADAPVEARAAADGGWTVHGGCPAVVGGVGAGLLLVVAETDGAAETNGAKTEAGAAEPLLLLVAAHAPGLTGAAADPLFGLPDAGLAHLSFDGVAVGAPDRLGADRQGTRLLRDVQVAQQLSLAVAAAAGARAALDWTVRYVHERKAFGQPLAHFENTRMALGDVAADLLMTQAFVDACLADHAGGGLAPARAAAAKLRATDLLGRAVDAGVQLHGGYGYMTEYPIARLYADARVLRVIGGTSEQLRLQVAQAAGV
jgi:acyl-CoA dehydrogenase